MRMLHYPRRHGARRLLAAAAVATALFVASEPSRADALDDARAAGLVCEGPDGYLQPAGTVAADIKSLIQSINAQRRAAYAEKATAGGYSPEEIAARTYEKQLRQYAC